MSRKRKRMRQRQAMKNQQTTCHISLGTRYQKEKAQAEATKGVSHVVANHGSSSSDNRSSDSSVAPKVFTIGRQRRLGGMSRRRRVRLAR